MTGYVEERRNHERIETHIATRLWLAEQYRGKEIEFEGFATVCDLAIGGAFVRADYLLPIGFPMNLDIMISDEEILSCRGEIVHTISEHESFETGMGLMFTQVDTENRERLLRFFVSDRIRDFYYSRFLQEFPHLESRFSLSEITLVLNLWEDKENRLATLKDGVSEGDRNIRRFEEIEATKARAASKKKKLPARVKPKSARR